MAWFAPVMFPVFLLTMGMLNYFGIRRDRAPMSILAAVALIVLVYWGGAYAMDLARFWSGRDRELHAIGVEVFPALLLTALKIRGWLHG